MTLNIQMHLNLPPEEEAYLDSCCRIRDISRSRLVSRLIRRILHDQMVLSVLDDESSPTKKALGEIRCRHRRPKRKSPRASAGGSVSLVSTEGGV